MKGKKVIISVVAIVIAITGVWFYFINKGISNYKVDSKERAEYIYANAVFDEGNNFSKEEWLKAVENDIDILGPLDYKVSKTKLDNRFNLLLVRANKHMPLKGNNEYENILPKKTKDAYGIYSKIKFETFVSSYEPSVTEYIEETSKLISETKEKGIVLDYRGDNGGNTEAHILGISPLLPKETPLIYSVSEDGIKLPFKLVYEGDNLETYHSEEFMNEINFINKENVGIDRFDLKVAVLIDDNTFSAAEYATLALKNNKNVKVFGKPSGGFTSWNSKGILKNDEMIFITSAWLEDTNCNLYKNKPITPDIDGYSQEEIVRWLNE